MEENLFPRGSCGGGISAIFRLHIFFAIFRALLRNMETNMEANMEAMGLESMGLRLPKYLLTHSFGTHTLPPSPPPLALGGY